MSLAEIRATVKITSVVRALDRLRKVDTKTAFRELRGPARYDQTDHDRNTQGPDGAWPALAASTLARRERHRGRGKNGKNRSWPKKLLGRMPRALQSIASAKSLIVRSRVRKFGFVHQASGVAGHGAHIPRRQYLWISPWLKKQAVIAFERMLERAARGA